jgi:hypothetical protein
MVGRAQVQVHGVQGRGGASASTRRRTSRRRLACSARVGDPVAAADLVPGNAARLQRAALAAWPSGRSWFWACRLRTRTLRRWPNGPACRPPHLAAEHGAGDHRALAGQREHAVDREPEQAVAPARRLGLGLGVQVGAQRGHARVIGLLGGGGKIGAPASGVGASSAAMSARTWARRSAGTRSALLRATLAWRTPSSSTMSRCSRVCGITPSSAATTSSAWSMPTAPAAMVWTKRSWPGTSMKPSTSPLASGV